MAVPVARPAGREAARAAALRFVVLLGVVSMFSDMTHEGARGITGPFLGMLGASALIVATVAGVGEFLGYALRFLFGSLADRTGMYWPITLVGYTIQMLAVPALALVGHWPAAALLIVTERSGRAMRNPPRDAMLAHATCGLGAGWVFGLREALDAAGAMIGPLIVAATVYVRGGYRLGFAVLIVPALLTLIVLLSAWRQYPRPHDLGAPERIPQAAGIPRVFWIYLGGMALVAAAYVDYPLAAYHFARSGAVPPAWIPILYAVAMAAEAAGALALGRLFDRIGLATVVWATAATAFFGPFIFLGNTVLVVLGMVLWGLGIAAQESVVKAAVTGMVGAERRASAYGLFDAGFGTAWMLGSVALGVLYNLSVYALVAFTVLLQLAALPVFAATRRAMPTEPVQGRSRGNFPGNRGDGTR